MRYLFWGIRDLINLRWLAQVSINTANTSIGNVEIVARESVHDT